MIEIYIRHGCPFCQMVINRVKELKLEEGKDFKIINAEEGTPGRETVLKAGGKSQVPFMIDEKTDMYESDDIISYIEEKFAS